MYFCGKFEICFAMKTFFIKSQSLQAKLIN